MTFGLNKDRLELTHVIGVAMMTVMTMNDGGDNDDDDDDEVENVM